MPLILIIMAQAGASGAAPLTPISGFWKNWGDGNAEIAVYELSTMRYGEERKGYAIAIVVTEPWNLTKNVNPTATRGETLSQPSSSTLFVISRPVCTTTIR